MAAILVATVVLLTAWGMLRAKPTAATKPTAETMPTFPGAVKGAKITKEGWFAPTKRKNPLPPLPEKVTKVFIIPIREAILAKTFESMKRKATWAKGKGAELIVFDAEQVLADPVDQGKRKFDVILLTLGP